MIVPDLISLDWPLSLTICLKAKEILGFISLGPINHKISNEFGPLMAGKRAAKTRLRVNRDKFDFG
jgi:hypothetical protein